MLVSWQPPVSNGGSAVAQYSVACSPTNGGPTVKGACSGKYLSFLSNDPEASPPFNLTAGANYTCTVKAKSASNCTYYGPADQPYQNKTCTLVSSAASTPSAVYT